nr:MAG TPA: hypothetical protein [Caudoviricetes sp.]
MRTSKKGTVREFSNRGCDRARTVENAKGKLVFPSSQPKWNF